MCCSWSPAAYMEIPRHNQRFSSSSRYVSVAKKHSASRPNKSISTFSSIFSFSEFSHRSHFLDLLAKKWTNTRGLVQPQRLHADRTCMWHQHFVFNVNVQRWYFGKDSGVAR
ncbi:hypothetical protein QX201_012227 [Fusarium graminearum]